MIPSLFQRFEVAKLYHIYLICVAVVLLLVRNDLYDQCGFERLSCNIRLEYQQVRQVQ